MKNQSTVLPSLLKNTLFKIYDYSITLFYDRLYSTSLFRKAKKSHWSIKQITLFHLNLIISNFFLNIKILILKILVILPVHTSRRLLIIMLKISSQFDKIKVLLFQR